jgi:type II secretory pathway component PulJ
MKVLRLNEKGNKSKRKTVKEKEKNRIETALNTFEKDSREREARGRDERGRRERGVEQTQLKHPTLLNPNYNHHQPPLNTIQLTHYHLNK